jgi:hypothetical protein
MIGTTLVIKKDGIHVAVGKQMKVFCRRNQHFLLPAFVFQQVLQVWDRLSSIRSGLCRNCKKYV